MFILLFAHKKALFEGLLNRYNFFDILFLISVLNNICYTKIYGLDIALAIFCGIFIILNTDERYFEQSAADCAW
jgi:hypothetical protein